MKNLRSSAVLDGLGHLSFPHLEVVGIWLYFLLPAVLAYYGPFWSIPDEASSGG